MVRAELASIAKCYTIHSAYAQDHLPREITAHEAFGTHETGEWGRDKVEIDRRTVTGQAQEWSHGQHDWAKKITTYLAYIRSGKYAARYGTRQGRILTVTTGQRRLANLKAITEERGGKARFWFTTLAQINAGDILTDSIWSVATRTTVHPLVETSNDKPPGLAAKVSEKR